MNPAYNKEIPYNDLPLLPPKHDIETKATLKAAIRARAALAELKGAGRLIPNQAMLVRAIVLQEARQSSEIENIVTTSDELYQAFSLDSGTSDAHTKEVMRYGDAVWHGVAHLKAGGRVSTSLFCELCSIILESQTEVRDRPGTRIGNSVTREVVYTPPEGAARILGLLDNLTAYLYDGSDVDPLIKLAVSHYQLEAIHPFIDGNGRTGRVVNILFLVDQGLLDLPVLYLSRFINENKGQYYKSLRRVTENQEWEPWVLFLLEAIEEMAAETRRRIELVREALDSASDAVKVRLPKIYSRELMEVVFSQPYCRVALLERAGIAKRQTAAKYLDLLTSAGILRKTQVWRDNLYLNPELMRILNS